MNKREELLIDFSSDEEVPASPPVSHPMPAAEISRDLNVPHIGQLSLRSVRSVFERLPSIVRNKIYGILVASDSTDVTLQSHTEDSSGTPMHCYSKRVTYRSIIAMMLVNKTIGAESRSYFALQHPFIAITTTDEASTNTVTLASRKLRAVCYSAGYSAPQCILRFTLSHSNMQHDGCGSTIVLNATYLLHFIQLLNLVLPTFIFEAEVKLELNPAPLMSAMDVGKMSCQILGSFRALTHVQNVVLSRNINGVYAEGLRATMLSRPPLWPHLCRELDASRQRASLYIDADEKNAAALEYEESHRLCNAPHSIALIGANPSELLRHRIMAIGGYISVSVPVGWPQTTQFIVDCANRLLDTHAEDIKPALRAKLRRVLGMMYLRRADVWTPYERVAGRPLEHLDKAERCFLKSLEDEPDKVSALLQLENISESQANWRAIVAAHLDFSD
ncbi:hypothetical protein MMC11_000788 [Xylographa trunciseda]|nr:hypothetical protein [Xylographa trunciseda]